MYKLIFGLFGAALVVIAGCASSGSNVSESSRYARLPTGATLLDSHRSMCAGVLEVDERSASGRSLGNGIALRRGQNATFSYDAADSDDRISYSCVGDVRSDAKRIDCPNATSHVRISRAAEGDDTLFECYGSARSSDRARG